ncbi:MAG: DUF3990 domain-containing protein [Bacteroidales bacterium]|nr:DUF3990 domain-containing protein [Bacteroidales bacterium]
MTNLYHGTNVDFDKITLSKCKPYKDFGRGFYLSDSEKHAQDMSIRRTTLEEEGNPTILKYSFDETALSNNKVKSKVFDGVSEEWALFIIGNRKHAKNIKDNKYDIVIGPVADDGVVYQINRYQQHIIDLPTLVKELTYRKLNKQYFFGSEIALTYLTRIK